MCLLFLFCFVLFTVVTSVGFTTTPSVLTCSPSSAAPPTDQPVARTRTATFVKDDSLMLYGGSTSSGSLLGDLWSADDSLSWTLLYNESLSASDPPPLAGAVLVECRTNSSSTVSFCLLFGYSSSGPHDASMIYRITSGVWDHVPSTDGGDGIPVTNGGMGAVGITIARPSNESLFTESTSVLFSVNSLWELRDSSTEGTNYTFTLLSSLSSPSSHTHMPGSRTDPLLWSASSLTNNQTTLYLFGGKSLTDTPLNDLWKFRLGLDFGVAQSWILIGGKTDPFEDDSCSSEEEEKEEEKEETFGYYGNTGWPGVRYDSLGFYCGGNDESFCIFGGRKSSFVFEDLLSDLWIFNPIMDQWMLVTDSLTLPHAELGYAFGNNNNNLIFMGLGFAQNSICADEDILLPQLFTDAIAFEWNRSCHFSLFFDVGACSGHGRCSESATCECSNSHEGQMCQTRKAVCKGLVATDSQVCGGDGAECVADESCLCDVSMRKYGQWCEEFISGTGFIFNQESEPYISVEWKLPLNELVSAPFNNITDHFDCSLVLVPDTLSSFSTSPDHCEFIQQGASQTSSLRIYSSTAPTTLTLYIITHSSYPSLTETAEVTLTSPYVVETPQTLAELLLDLWPAYVAGAIIICFLLVAAFLLIFACVHAWRKSRGSGEDISGMFSNSKQRDQVLREEENQRDLQFDELPIPEERKLKLFNVEFSDLTIVDALSAGNSAAVVYRVTFDGQPMVLKLFRTKDMSYSIEAFEAFEKEVHTMRTMSHAALLDFYGCTLSVPRIGVLLEYCPHGDLKSYIESEENARLPLKAKLYILRTIADVMVYLNSHEIVHRDLKSENIVLAGGFRPKLIDYGLSRVVEGGSTSLYVSRIAGASHYLAPEVTLSSRYTSGADVYSFSMVMFEVMTEEFEPFGSDIDFNVELKVALNPKFRPKLEEEPIANIKPLTWLCALIRRCWQADPESRPMFEEIRGIISENINPTIEALGGGGG